MRFVFFEFWPTLTAFAFIFQEICILFSKGGDWFGCWHFRCRKTCEPANLVRGQFWSKGQHWKNVDILHNLNLFADIFGLFSCLVDSYFQFDKKFNRCTNFRHHSYYWLIYQKRIWKGKHKKNHNTVAWSGHSTLIQFVMILGLMIVTRNK